MSINEARKFIRKLIREPGFREELEQRLPLDPSGDPEGEIRSAMAEVVPVLASEHGYDFTAEEGFDALETLRENFENEELSDDELERVAGGKDSMKIVTSVISAGIICGAISATAATDDLEADCGDALS